MYRDIRSSEIQTVHYLTTNRRTAIIRHASRLPPEKSPNNPKLAALKNGPHLLLAMDDNLTSGPKTMVPLGANHPRVLGVWHLRLVNPTFTRTLKRQTNVQFSTISLQPARPRPMTFSLVRTACERSGKRSQRQCL